MSNKQQMPSIWALPKLSMGFWPVYIRNALVWSKLALASLIGNIAEPLIALFAFGYGVGALIGTVVLHGQSVPYILFLASGFICIGAMNAASFEALYSVYSRMHVQKTWNGILYSPIELEDIVIAELIWSTTKALLSACIMALVIMMLGISRSPLILISIAVLALIGCCFSCLALICTAVAKSYELFTFYFSLILTPMTFLSGVFFPTEQFPLWLQKTVSYLPLSAGVDLVRPLLMGHWPSEWLRPFIILLIYTVASFWLAMALFRKRFRI
jgi:lipooligosaccharide transport system permease protein